MSDEESFVILGSCSPGNSLLSPLEESLRYGFPSLEISKIEKKENDGKESTAQSIDKKDEKAQKSLSNDGLESAASVNEEVFQLAREEQLVNDDAKTETNEEVDKTVENKQSGPAAAQTGGTTPMNRSSGSGSSDNGSLAASFIMGEVNAEVLKSSVYSQFPSLSMEACAEDVVKLQNFMAEYIELKSILAKVNGTMKIFYDKTQQWRDEMQRTEQQYKQQLQNCQAQIEMLRNENLKLKRDIEAKLEHMRSADALKKKETDGLIQMISEKATLVEHLRSQLDNLEKQSMVFISKAGNDSASSSDYTDRSELLAENLELKDMQKVYVEEINCLKVSLISAEELHRQSRRDIDFLKAKDIENSERFRQYELERDKMREEILLLRQQVDVYSKDFQMERAARETLAGEKDKLLQDIRAIQRTNQQLIEDQKRHLDTALYPTTTSTTGDSGNATNQASSSHSFRCPVCGNGFQTLEILQSHVNSCLDNS